MDEFIVVGEIVKAQGLSGEVKIKPLTNDAVRFKKLRAAYIDTALCQILAARIEKDFVFVRFAGTDTREKAEQLVGKRLKIDRLHSVNTDEGEFFIADLLSCRLVTDDARFNGKIINVLQHGAADVIEVELDEGGMLMFPFLKSLKMQADAKAKRVNVCLDALQSVAVINEQPQKKHSCEK